jgi:hypothetical protein
MSYGKQKLNTLMNFLIIPKDIRRLALAALTLTAFSGAAMAVDLLEDFDADTVDTAIWDVTGGEKTRTVAEGRLTWNADGGDWTSGDISTVARYILPPVGQTTKIEWTLGPGAVTVTNPLDGGSSIRMQMGIHSANEPARRREHWPNTTGGVWLDLYSINPATTASVGAFYGYANDTKVTSSQATTLSYLTSAWSWQSNNRVFRLEITSTGYTWFDQGVQTAQQEWAAAGIDTELQNGYRVLALGMNYNKGRGTTAVERIEITNAFFNTSLITNYGSSLPSPFSGQPVTLSWVVDPDATISINQGIGSVGAMTVAGVGSLTLTPPLVAAATSVEYVLTVTKGANVATRSATINIQPPPTTFMDNFFDDFLGDSLDVANWNHRGGKTYTVANSRINWEGNGANWDNGEVTSLNVYPLPPTGKTTTITWNLGPATAVTTQSSTNALRPQFGIVSAFEPNGGSLQQWPNTTGGIWMDITDMSTAKLDGVSGRIGVANDQKRNESDPPQVSSVDIPDWNWTTDSHSISLAVTQEGYAWFNGLSPLYSGEWAASSVDTELSKGFRVMFMAGNWDGGRGPMSLESISVSNGAAPAAVNFVIGTVTHDPALDRTVVSFNSEATVNYALDASPSLTTGTWNEVATGVATGNTTTLTHTTATTTKLFYRVRNKDLRPAP